MRVLVWVGWGGKRWGRGMNIAMSVPNLLKLGALEARIFISEYFISG